MSRLPTYNHSLYIQLEMFFFIMVVTDLEGRGREQERQSWMLGNFTLSLPGSGKLPVDCECSHLKTSISTFFPFSFWFPFPGYCEPAFYDHSGKLVEPFSSADKHEPAFYLCVSHLLTFTHSTRWSAPAILKQETCVLCVRTQRTYVDQDVEASINNMNKKY